MTILFVSLLILAILIIVFINVCNNTSVAINKTEIIFDIITEKYGRDECDKIRLEYIHRILPPPMEEIK